MQKVSRTAMLKVLDSLANVPKDKPAAVMNALFGKGSLGAFAPLLANLDLLRTNFNRFADGKTGMMLLKLWVGGTARLKVSALLWLAYSLCAP